jgi:hypothetical protein
MQALQRPQRFVRGGGGFPGRDSLVTYSEGFWPMHVQFNLQAPRVITLVHVVIQCPPPRQPVSGRVFRRLGGCMPYIMYMIDDCLESSHLKLARCNMQPAHHLSEDTLHWHFGALEGRQQLGSTCRISGGCDVPKRRACSSS